MPGQEMLGSASLSKEGQVSSQAWVSSHSPHTLVLWEPKEAEL